jgi:hypothetical protein
MNCTERACFKVAHHVDATGLKDCIEMLQTRCSLIGAR